MADTLTWYGHSNFRIDADGTTILVDPFFEGNPRAPVSSATITACDAVLLTHDHGDHVGSTVDICKATGAWLVSIVGTAGKLQQAGVPASQIANGIGINIGGSIEIAGIKITMTQAFHSSDSGAPTGYILTLPSGVTIYHAGDTGLFSSMELWGQLYKIDYALLPIGGVFTMDARQAALACKLLGCAKVVPMHWGTFPVLEQNTSAFAQALAEFAPGTRLTPMSIGTPPGFAEDKALGPEPQGFLASQNE
ncbi:MAG: metal-dependent hydrolase [Proteobacteria bacterium]|nr:metal-dependent hydrolase [Pseudomonadota bacterium]